MQRDVSVTIIVQNTRVKLSKNLFSKFMDQDHFHHT